MPEGNFTIYHNPRCRKSRESLEILRKERVEPEIVKYLENTPSPEELHLLLSKLDLSVEEIIRKEERLYKEKFKNLNFTESEWLRVLHENPILIQRPIAVRGSRAVLGRPPENVYKLLK